MRITFLGTSSGTPTRSRNVTSQALSLDHGAIWLLDCGEATQHQCMRAGLRPSRIERILLTHLHGDHCFGLPGMLACMSMHERQAPVRIAGPRGIGAWIDATLQLTDTTLSFPLVVDELSGDGGDLAPLSGWSVAARPLVHRVPCFGFSLREEDRPGRFSAEQAALLGIPAGPAYGVLQRGGSVTAPDGRMVLSSQVTAPRRRGRHVVLLGDTSDPSGIAAEAQGCDVLVCEATYDQDRADKARQWGHSTSAMTGSFAAAIGARTLIITHFSSRYTDGPAASAAAATGAATSTEAAHPGQTVDDLVQQAQARCPQTAVLAASDLWTYEVPGDG